jgi:hypothetical protein
MTIENGEVAIELVILPPKLPRHTEGAERLRIPFPRAVSLGVMILRCSG